MSGGGAPFLSWRASVSMQIGTTFRISEFCVSNARFSHFGQSCRMFSRTDHFRSDRVVERDPGLSQLGRKCCAELVFQTPDQRITKRDEVQWGNSEVGMLSTRVPDDRLKQFMLIKCPNDCRDHVHELEVLSFHVAREQTLRIGSKLEEPAIEQLRDFASDGPDRIE